VLMYGQTGSGKTFTMTAIYERAANEVSSERTVLASAISFGVHRRGRLHCPCAR